MHLPEHSGVTGSSLLLCRTPLRLFFVSYQYFPQIEFKCKFNETGASQRSPLPNIQKRSYIMLHYTWAKARTNERSRTNVGGHDSLLILMGMCPKNRCECLLII